MVILARVNEAMRSEGRGSALRSVPVVPMMLPMRVSGAGGGE